MIDGRGGAPSSVRAKIARKVAKANPSLRDALALTQLLWPMEARTLQEARGKPEDVRKVIDALITKHALKDGMPKPMVWIPGWQQTHGPNL